MAGPQQRTWAQVLAVGVLLSTIAAACDAARGTPAPSPGGSASHARPSPAAASEPPACAVTALAATPRGVQQASAGAGAVVVCLPAGEYGQRLRLSVPGQTWRLAEGAILRAGVRIDAPGAALVGGQVTVATDDAFYPSVTIAAHDVTVEAVTFDGGGLGISVLGVDRARIVRNSFRDLLGTAVFLWGEADGADGALIEGNVITQEQARRSSPISSRGSDDASVINKDLVVRDNKVDQGTQETGWFGIELKATPGAIVEENEIRGGQVLISLPDSDNTVVRRNLLDMRGSPYWGVEIASSDGVQVIGNEFRGRGRDAGQTAVSMNSGSLRALIRGNRVTAISTLVDLTGDGHRAIANCLIDVARQFDYRSSAGRDLVFDNDEC